MSNNRKMPIADAYARVTGTRPHPSTCWRWYKRGVKGVKLDTWLVCGRRMATTKAVRQFIDETIAAANSALCAADAIELDTPPRRTKQDEVVMKRLNRKLGLVS